MALDQSFVGRTYPPTPAYEVGREKIREFASAVKDEHPAHQDGTVASLTFLAVAGRRVQLDLFENFDVPINLERVLHRDQKLIFHRPIKVGDKLWFDSYLDSVIESHGTVICEVRAEVTDDAGAPVATSIVTMLGEAQIDEANEVSAQIAAARDAAIAKMVASQKS